tara:strand:- start:187 stop:477 length:291 start_codon:yes stop_codon:yes gene_type:complete
MISDIIIREAMDIVYRLYHADHIRRESTKKASSKTAESLFVCGAPGAIRTRDPLIRSQVLYPAELRAPKQPGIYSSSGSRIQEFFISFFDFYTEVN